MNKFGQVMKPQEIIAKYQEPINDSFVRDADFEELMESRGRGSDSEATPVDAAVVPTKITVYSALMSGRRVPDEGVALEVDAKCAIKYIRSRIKKELRVCCFELVLGAKQLTDRDASAFELGIQHGATLTIIRISPTEEKLRQLQLWRKLEFGSDKNRVNEVFLTPKLIKKIGWPCLEQALIETRVSRLFLCHCGLGDYEAEIVAEAVVANPDIEQLWLNGNNISHVGASFLAQLLKTHQNLKCIGVARNNISDIGAAELAQAVEVNDTVVQIDFSNNQIKDDGAIAIAKMLKTSKNLERIYIDQNNISDTGAVEIGKGLKTNKNLDRIDLAQNNISDIGAVEIAKAVEVNNTLVTLNLANNKIQNDGAIAIANAIQANNTLVSLNLASNNIQNDGAIAIANAIPANVVLTRVGMANNQFRNIPGRKALRQAEDARQQQGKPIYIDL